MTSPAAVDQEIGALIREHGRITFARFMEAALYSRRGGFYSSTDTISGHFGTSAMSHPAFGSLIARQLEEMWQRLGKPPVFHAIEVGSGDGSLARAIVHACSQMASDFGRALCYVAADYEPRASRTPDAAAALQRVKADALQPFRNVVGCILSNELIDNLPVHRFAIEDGRVKEVFVTLAGGDFVEVLDEPSSDRIEERLASLGVSLAEGYRGEVNLAIEDWTRQVSSALERGFVLTIDYGDEAAELYGPANKDGTLVCYHRHAARDDPYRDIGQQDITCHADFTSLMRLGERHGLSTVGYTPQGRFLANLGFSSLLDALDAQGLTPARTELSRMAMMSLVDPEQYGGLKVLAQAKGIAPGGELLGFASSATR
jgi:SAM-dependent MidA family methyltransferase